MALEALQAKTFDLCPQIYREIQKHTVSSIHIRAQARVYSITFELPLSACN